MIVQNNELKQNNTNKRIFIILLKVVLFILELPCDIILIIIKIRIQNESILHYIIVLLSAILKLIVNLIVKAYNFIIAYLINLVAKELLKIIIEEAQKPNSEIIHKFKILLRILRRREANANNRITQVIRRKDR